MPTEIKLNKRNFANLSAAIDAAEMKSRILNSDLINYYGCDAIESFFISRVIPRGHEGFVVQYRTTLRRSGTNHLQKQDLWGRLYGPKEKVREDEVVGNKYVVYFPDIRLTIPVFPYDPEIPYLRAYIDMPAASTAFLAQIPDLFDKNCRIISREILGYRIGRRAVIRYTWQSKQEAAEIVLKLIRPEDSQRNKNSALLEKLKSGESHQGWPDMPRIYYYDFVNGIFIMESIKGSSLHDLLAENEFSGACESAGKLIKQLHSRNHFGLPSYSQVNELEGLAKNSRIFSAIFPEWSAKLLNVQELLIAKIDVAKNYSDSGIIHRDFYDKQVLYSTPRVSLIDCENLYLGDPAIDYGNFLAHLELRKLQEPALSRNIKAGESSFIDSYGSPAGNFAQRSEWWKAAALIRLSILYALRPRWNSISPDILNLAETILMKI